MGITLREQPRPETGSRTCIPNFKPKTIKRRPRPPTLADYEVSSLMTVLAPAEVKALHWIAENGDLIIVADKAWLLTPAPKSLIDILAAVGANTADLEPDADRENEHDDDGVDDSETAAAGVALSFRKVPCRRLRIMPREPAGATPKIAPAELIYEMINRIESDVAILQEGCKCCAIVTEEVSNEQGTTDLKTVAAWVAQYLERLSLSVRDQWESVNSAAYDQAFPDAAAKRAYLERAE